MYWAWRSLDWTVPAPSYKYTIVIDTGSTQLVVGVLDFWRNGDVTYRKLHRGDVNLRFASRLCKVKCKINDWILYGLAWYLNKTIKKQRVNAS